MRINVTTTIEIETKDEQNITQEEVDNAYEEFTNIIQECVGTGDITNFLFINEDTNMQIEDDV